jgi:hypothetical protein
MEIGDDIEGLSLEGSRKAGSLCEAEAFASRRNIPITEGRKKVSHGPCQRDVWLRNRESSTEKMNDVDFETTPPV